MLIVFALTINVAAKIARALLQIIVVFLPNLSANVPTEMPPNMPPTAKIATATFLNEYKLFASFLYSRNLHYCIDVQLACLNAAVHRLIEPRLDFIARYIHIANMVPELKTLQKKNI